jgi:hypothetical protein
MADTDYTTFCAPCCSSPSSLVTLVELVLERLNDTKVYTIYSVKEMLVRQCSSSKQMLLNAKMSVSGSAIQYGDLASDSMTV